MGAAGPLVPKVDAAVASPPNSGVVGPAKTDAAKPVDTKDAAKPTKKKGKKAKKNKKNKNKKAKKDAANNTTAKA